MRSAVIDPMVKAVTYKLQGETIKHALLVNPGKVILCQPQCGTRSLAEFMVENYPDGVTVQCLAEGTAHQLKKWLPEKFFNLSTIIWGSVEPPNYYGNSLPLFADDIGLYGGTLQIKIIRDPRFRGAVSCLAESATPELRELCIQC